MTTPEKHATIEQRQSFPLPWLTEAEKHANIIVDIDYIARSAVLTSSTAVALTPIVGPVFAFFVTFLVDKAFDNFWHGEDILG